MSSHACSPGHGLPVELVDKIIDFCSDDWKTLLSITLICKTWLPLAHAYLFDRIRVRHPLHEPGHQFDICKKVLDSNMAKYIRHVSLHFQGPVTPGEEVQYITDAVNRIRNSSNVLTSLGIHYHEQPELTPFQGTLESLPSFGPFTNIVELNLWLKGGKLTPNMLHFVCSFPHLQVLGVYLWEVALSNGIPKATLPLSLKSIHLNLLDGGSGADYLYKWLSSQSAAVSELSLFGIKSLDLNACVTSFSKSLRTLNISFHYGPPMLKPRDCDLSPSQVLESLTFRGPSSECHFQAISLMLETVSSPYFQTLSMTDVSICPISSHSPKALLAQRQFKNLDDLLATEKLSRVTVEIHFSAPRRDFYLYEQTARRCFGRCYMQGRLVVLGLKRKPVRRRWTNWGIFEFGMKLHDQMYY
ncbi:hypothetical protein L218DRAFT_1008720 [Marasmius fiardii PR-910]|nr:hypothetical protein L218DRAFT_1008720 [Marasmius fiardii PR-910]